MSRVLVATNVLLATAVGVVTHHLIRYRRRAYQAEGKDLGWPIPAVSLEELHPRFRPDELGPTLDGEVHFIGAGGGVPGGTSDAEAWVLAVLARDARLMFEFGTFTGKTAYLLARNSPDDARVVTLTLAPEQHQLYAPSREDDELATREALNESKITGHFRYTGTPEERKITQLYGDSKALDETPYRGLCDLIFVDGSHAYSYVKSDTEKALRMLRPGGIILWHDYRGKYKHTRGVFDYLNELAQRLPLVRLAGTTLVAYRSPAEGIPM